MQDKFVYLIGCLALFIPWLFLFVQQDKRHKIIMLTVGAFIATGSVIGQAYLWTNDWWFPPNITGTLVGIEDALSGLFTGGISVVLCKYLLHGKEKKTKSPHHLLAVLISLSTLFFGLFFFYYLSMNSVISLFLALTLSTLFILYIRSDLFKESFLSGIFMTITILPSYIAMYIAVPDFASKYYYVQVLEGFKLLSFPVEEFLTFFLLGIFASTLYYFWSGKTLILESKNSGKIGLDMA